MTVTFARAVVSIVLIQVSSSLSLYYFYPIILRVKLRTSSWMGFIRGLEEVYMNWIGKLSVIELTVCRGSCLMCCRSVESPPGASRKGEAPTGPSPVTPTGWPGRPVMQPLSRLSHHMDWQPY